MNQFKFNLSTAIFIMAVLVFFSACSKDDEEEGVKTETNTDTKPRKSIKITAYHNYPENGTRVETLAIDAKVSLYKTDLDRSLEQSSFRNGETDSLGKLNFTFLTDSIYYLEGKYGTLDKLENINLSNSGEILFFDLVFVSQ